MNDPLASLRLSFLERCRQDLEILRAADLARPSPDFRTAIHRLSGAGGLFGFPEISTLAARLDDALYEGQALRADDLAALAAAVEAIF